MGFIKSFLHIDFIGLDSGNKQDKIIDLELIDIPDCFNIYNTHDSRINSLVQMKGRIKSISTVKQIYSSVNIYCYKCGFLYTRRLSEEESLKV